MQVLKFGGTSVGTFESLQLVNQIITEKLQNNIDITVVVSAFGGVTNQLLELSERACKNDDSYKSMFEELKYRHVDAAQKLIGSKAPSNVITHINQLFSELDGLLQGIYLLKDLTPRTRDLLSSFGERLSSFIICEGLKAQGIDAEACDARKLIKTDNGFSNARVLSEKTEQNIKRYFEKHKSLQIVTGFIASTTNLETTTLGRGGSDYTAAILASALSAECIEIWTDVNGILTADPRVVKDAFPLEHISYTEAMELSHFGAKVIYPPTLQPAFSKNIPIKIRNTFNSKFEGTLISEQAEENESLITGISSIDKVTLINVLGSGMVGTTGISGRLFTALARENVNIIMITQASSEYSICFAVTPKEKDAALKAINQEFEYEIITKRITDIDVQEDTAIVAIIGEQMRKTTGISGKMFSALGKNGINVVAISQGSTEYNVSAVIRNGDLSKAINALHEVFFLSETQSMHLFVVGVGLIGSTLLNEFSVHQKHLYKDQHLQVQLNGISNSKTMICSDETIDFNSWKEELQNSNTSADLDLFVNKMIALNLPNSVFVDNTANSQIVKYYPAILKSNISVVTPNKIAISGPYIQYKELKDLAKFKNANFKYETNVGAGLPIINTLSNLLSSGDEVIRIEAVLSGTLSYIFNHFTNGKKFSAVVKEALDKGFTEPDPREDLSGKDVARKILILAREAGYELEP
ncbi:MAG: bifunctional aspartate kinase/homoserine dehydrogenase I, partial [Bacteroidia bacterium]|nr:bifunctional aspartate kinase/homoserine dehydrogenase I [Bacteroidia bacterium]